MPGNKPITPVKPAGMEIVFLYQCPHCGREVTLIAPTRPAMCATHIGKVRIFAGLIEKSCRVSAAVAR